MVSKKKASAETALVKYVFLDIVGFTRNRSVEAQSDVVAALNLVVRECLRRRKIAAASTILIPTGDGMAIALLEPKEFDIHLTLAVALLEGVERHNAETDDAMRQFEVRIGVNENVDNIVIDINGEKNVAGNGISMAQRIMDKADGGQILVGNAVYETLAPRERYMQKFESFGATGKHGVQFKVHQYIDLDTEGLNIAIPTAFAGSSADVKKVVPLSDLAARYIREAFKHEALFSSKRDDPMRDYIAVVLLMYYATDSLRSDNADKHDKPYLRTWKAGEGSPTMQYDYYAKQDLSMLQDLAKSFAMLHLSAHERFFSGFSALGKRYWLLAPGAVAEAASLRPDLFEGILAE